VGLPLLNYSYSIGVAIAKPGEVDALDGGSGTCNGVFKEHSPNSLGLFVDPSVTLPLLGNGLEHLGPVLLVLEGTVDINAVVQLTHVGCDLRLIHSAIFVVRIHKGVQVCILCIV